jgi:glycosyltransferase involved in cell wall biosynthesis
LAAERKESQGLVSIVIPAYNAGQHIAETLDSIISQTYSHFEIIFINDGSTDNTEGVIKNYSDARIQCYVKQNEGVSKARNWGIELAKGLYVVFFDADDIMSADFLQIRVALLENNAELGFCCGEVENFPLKNNKRIWGACDNVPTELLLEYNGISSCPSNYMFRASIINSNHLRFSSTIASPADRLFLMQINAVTKGKRVEGGRLKYRVNEESMSTLSLKWAVDNEIFYNILVSENLIPRTIYRQATLKNYVILGKSYAKIGAYGRAFKMFLYFLYHKLNFK